MSITSSFMRSVLVASLLATGVVLVGCEGDDGLDGAQGPPGQPGEPGAPGPEGPPGVGTTKPLESCGVCHDAGSVGDAVVAHAITGVATVSDVSVANVGGDLVFGYHLQVDGQDAAGFDQVVSNYRFRISVLSSTAAPVLTAGAAVGDYSIRVPNGATGTSPGSRFFFRVTDGTSAAVVTADYPNPVLDFVSEQTCNNCHGDSGIAPHTAYGYPAMTASQCLVCHAPTSKGGANPPTFPLPSETDSWFALIHGIHNSHNMPSGFYEFAGEEFEVTYPTYMTNCSVCHDTPELLEGANEMSVTADYCFSCHESMEGFGEDAFEGSAFHLDFDETTNCFTCHNDTDGVAPGTVTAFHNGLTTERDGIIWDGLDTSVVEGEKIAWEIIDIVDDGADLAISWQASYDEVGVDPCNATPGEGVPAFHAIPPLGDEARNNLSILYSYAQGDDFILGTVTESRNTIPGQADNVPVTVDNTTCANGVATTTVTPKRIEGASRGIVAIQGKPWLPNVDPEGEDVYMQVRAKTPTYEFLVGSGDAPLQSRRDIVDTTNKCLKCHVGSLYQHGGNRVDNIDMCILCHNSASNEQNVRVGMGVEASEAYDGKVGQTFEMKSMLHAIHSAGEEGAAPIVIYRNRGIYAWATSRDLLPNWPGEGDQIVYGSNDVTQNHSFHTPTYPRALNDCGACHADTFTSIIPDQRVAMATTLEAGEEPWANQLDDVLQGASAAACTSCHSDGAAKGHAYQNGWTPQAFPEGRQTIIDATR